MIPSSFISNKLFLFPRVANVLLLLSFVISYLTMASQNKTCKSCHVTKNQEEFANKKGALLSKCLHCRNNIRNSRSKKNEMQADDIISYLDITEAVYDSLISLNHEGENEELNLSLNIELSSFIDAFLLLD
jgi:hypothetical protein